MQKVIQIPEERYDRMVESYDKAIEELEKLRAEFRGIESVRRGDLDALLNRLDDTQLRRAYFLLVAMQDNGSV